MPFEPFTARSFTPVSVRANAPAASGIYGICNAREWIFIGATDDIQASLLHDLQQGGSALLKRAPTGFVFELCDTGDRRARQDRLILEYEPVCNRRILGTKGEANDMTDSSTATKKEGGQFLLTGFTQAAGIRTYAFEGRVDASRIDYTVNVDLALIPRYGIRIHDVPLLCRELLPQRAQIDEISAIVFTEQRMRSHAEQLAMVRGDEYRKKRPKPLTSADAETDSRP